MKTYIAAPYAARDLCQTYRTELVRIGYAVTSTWLDDEHEIGDQATGAAPGLDDTAAKVAAHHCLGDVDRSDIVVMLTGSEAGYAPSRDEIDDVWLSALAHSGGRHVEVGYALARGIPVVVVGDPENIFHRGSGVVCVPAWHEAVLELAARLVDRERNQPQPSAGVDA